MHGTLPKFANDVAAKICVYMEEVYWSKWEEYGMNMGMTISRTCE